MGPDVPNAWDDEEEFEPQPLVSHGEAPKLSAEKQAKLDNEGEYGGTTRTPRKPSYRPRPQAPRTDPDSPT